MMSVCLLVLVVWLVLVDALVHQWHAMCLMHVDSVFLC